MLITISWHVARTDPCLMFTEFSIHSCCFKGAKGMLQHVWFVDSNGKSSRNVCIVFGACIFISHAAVPRHMWAHCCSSQMLCPLALRHSKEAAAFLLFLQHPCRSGQFVCSCVIFVFLWHFFPFASRHCKEFIMTGNYCAFKLMSWATMFYALACLHICNMQLVAKHSQNLS